MTGLGISSLPQSLDYGLGKGPQLNGATKYSPVIQGGCSHQESRSSTSVLPRMTHEHLGSGDSDRHRVTGTCGVGCISVFLAKTVNIIPFLVAQ